MFLYFSEDEEVFQIKKSSQSKKLNRMLDKERKKRKEKAEKMDAEEVEIKIENTKQCIPDDDIVV